MLEETLNILILGGMRWHQSGGGQQPTQIARALAAAGHTVFYYQDQAPLRPVAEATLIYPRDALRPAMWHPEAPGAASYWQAVADVLAVTVPAGRRVVIVTAPVPWYVAAAEVLAAAGWEVWFWALDDWSQFNYSWFVPARVTDLLAVCRGLIATSRPLAESLAAQSGRQVAYIPNGFDPRIAAGETVAPLARGERTLIYWGCVTGDWLDWDLLEAVALARPAWQFHLVGNQPEVPWGPENVHFHLPVLVEELGAYARAADVGIIPFRNNALVAAVNPIKAYEYLACGLPVMSTPMPELDGWPGVVQAATPAAWLETLDLLPRWPAAAVQKFLTGRTWSARAQAFEALLGEE